MYSKEISVKNSIGLHARPATIFIQKANEFRSSVWIERGEMKANAKSLLGVLSLGVTKDSVVTISAEGSDEKDAVYVLTSLVASEFGDTA
jgi:phosphocarrier protein